MLIRSSNLTDADLSNANLTDGRFLGSTFTGADLTAANLTNALMNNSTLTGANLTTANLTDADLFNANLTDADLSEAVVLKRQFWRRRLHPGAALLNGELQGEESAGDRSPAKRPYGLGFQSTGSYGCHSHCIDTSPMPT